MPLPGIQEILDRRKTARQKSLDSVTLSQEDQQSMYDQLLKAIGSLQSQTLNRYQDTATANEVPLATRLAGERGIALQGAQTAEQGAFDISKLAALTNIEGNKFLLNQDLQRQLAQMGIDAQKSNNLLSLIGAGAQGLGYLFGGGFV